MTIAAGYDLETTGLDPGDHRIIEVYIGLYKVETGKRFFEFETRIDPQRSILADTIKHHGITNSDVIGKPVWNVVAPKVSKILSMADFIVGHNGIDFDGPFTDYEMQRVGLPKIGKPIIDTSKGARWANPIGKYPKLHELCFACDVPYDHALAHAAAYDVTVMMECFFKARSWGYFPLPYEEKLAA